VFKSDGAGDGKRTQPCQPIRKITEAFAEENARLDGVGRIGLDSLRPRMTDAPRQAGRDHQLVEIIFVQQVLDRERSNIEARPLSYPPVSMNPSAFDPDRNRRGQQPRE
jgi:hypothetical protein